jgi:hypothetical protein
MNSNTRPAGSNRKVTQKELLKRIAGSLMGELILVLGFNKIFLYENAGKGI